MEGKEPVVPAGARGGPVRVDVDSLESISKLKSFQGIKYRKSIYALLAALWKNYRGPCIGVMISYFIRLS
jgi:hypothetical protein